MSIGRWTRPPERAAKKVSCKSLGRPPSTGIIRPTDLTLQGAGAEEDFGVDAGEDGKDFGADARDEASEDFDADVGVDVDANFGAGSGEDVSAGGGRGVDRKSTRLNSSHLGISYAVFCLKKKNTDEMRV